MTTSATSQALKDFTIAMSDAQRLLALHKIKQGGKPTVPEDVDAIKRGTLLLAVAAWETFIRDLLTERFHPYLNDAKSAQAFKEVLATVGKSWLASHKENAHEQLFTWTGNGWKKYVSDYFTDIVSKLYTPGPEKVKKVFRQFLNIDLVAAWSWNNYSHEQICETLDGLIRSRGEIAHKAPKRGEKPGKQFMTLPDLEKRLRFLEALAKNTEVAP
jgi:hypothetical protein